MLSFGGKSGTCLRRERREEESASTRGPPKNSSTANPSIASVSSWVAPFPPTSSSSSSSSSPPLLPPFIGSRISKSLVVKNAAALLRSACHARFLPTRTDGRTDGRADRHGGGIASVGRAAARRTAERASAKERNLNRADISPPFPKVAKPNPSTQHAKICATSLTEGFRVRDFFIRSRACVASVRCCCD